MTTNESVSVRDISSEIERLEHLRHLNSQQGWTLKLEYDDLTRRIRELREQITKEI